MTPEVSAGDAAQHVAATTAAQVGDLQRGPAWDRLENQVGWYERQSANSKRAYMALKVVQLIAAALVPVMASVHAAVWVTGGLGAVVVVLEGVQQLCQFQANWINYRSTAEVLKHEKYLYLAQAGPYDQQRDPQRVLAERVEAAISQENANWTSGQDEVRRGQQAQGGGAP
jgi:Protein of unknown function (DUF4231)